MSLFTQGIIDNLSKLSLDLLSDLRNFFHRFIDDSRVLAAIQKHLGDGPKDNGMADRVGAILYKNRKELNTFPDDLKTQIESALAPAQSEVTK